MSNEMAESEKVVEEAIKIREVSCMDTIHFRWPRQRGKTSTIRGVKLCFENVWFEAHPDGIYVDLPDAALEFLREIRAFDLVLASMSPTQLRKMAEGIVEDRIAAWRKARTKADKHMARFVGGHFYIGPDAPRTKQLQEVLKDLRRQQARQRAVLRDKRRLEWENSEKGRKAMVDAEVVRRKKANLRVSLKKER